MGINLCLLTIRCVCDCLRLIYIESILVSGSYLRLVNFFLGAFDVLGLFLIL